MPVLIMENSSVRPSTSFVFFFAFSLAQRTLVQVENGEKLLVDRQLGTECTSRSKNDHYLGMVVSKRGMRTYGEGW